MDHDVDDIVRDERPAAEEVQPERMPALADQRVGHPVDGGDGDAGVDLRHLGRRPAEVAIHAADVATAGGNQPQKIGIDAAFDRRRNRRRFAVQQVAEFLQFVAAVREFRFAA